MSLSLVFLALFIVGVYWFVTQIMPERRRRHLIRSGLGDGYLATLNDQRHSKGLPILEMDDELAAVAENKAVHQIMTGRDDEGWDYPGEYASLFGQSLFMEALLYGPAEKMVERILKQRDMFDAEWVRCGIGVAGGQSGQVVVAVILSREAWEPMVEANQARRRTLPDWFALGK